MAEINNLSGLPHVWVEKAGPSGESHDVLVVRGTFDLTAEGEPLTLSPEQSPIVYGDEFDGPVDTAPLRAVLQQEGNLVLFKPGTDLHVTGTAYSPGGKQSRSWLASVSLGAMNKTLRLHGPRRFRRMPGGWQLHPAEPVDSLALDYRHAFGGCWSARGRLPDAVELSYKPDNPAGCGWLPDDEAMGRLSPEARQRLASEIHLLSALDGPQIEHPDLPVQHPTQRLAAEGFAPMARWCEPRLRHAGTHDESWRSHRYPLPPEDFDPLFYQSAHPDLVCRHHLTGEEPLTLSGLFPDGPRSMRLPGVLLLARARTASGQQQAGTLQLDTVSVDLDAESVVLVWRAAFRRDDPVRHVAVGSVTRAGPPPVTARRTMDG